MLHEPGPGSPVHIETVRRRVSVPGGATVSERIVFGTHELKVTFALPEGVQTYPTVLAVSASGEVRSASRSEVRSASFLSLTPGTWTIEVDDSELASLRRKVRIEPGARPLEIALALEVGGVVTVTHAPDGASRSPPVEVVLVREGHTEMHLLGGGGSAWHTDHVPSGAWTLVVKHADGTTTERPVEVSNGETTKVTLDVE